MVYAAQFFSEKVGMYRVSTTDGTLMNSRMIDDGEILSAYNAAFVHLEGKHGPKYLMVNNHEEDESTNGIWTYEVPKNIWTGDWKKT